MFSIGESKSSSGHTPRRGIRKGAHPEIQKAHAQRRMRARGPKVGTSRWGKNTSCRVKGKRRGSTPTIYMVGVCAKGDAHATVNHG